MLLIHFWVNVVIPKKKKKKCRDNLPTLICPGHYFLVSAGVCMHAYMYICICVRSCVCVCRYVCVCMCRSLQVPWTIFDMKWIGRGAGQTLGTDEMTISSPGQLLIYVLVAFGSHQQRTMREPGFMRLPGWPWWWMVPAWGRACSLSIPLFPSMRSLLFSLSLLSLYSTLVATTTCYKSML